MDNHVFVLSRLTCLNGVTIDINTNRAYPLRVIARRRCHGSAYCSPDLYYPCVNAIHQQRTSRTRGGNYALDSAPSSHNNDFFNARMEYYTEGWAMTFPVQVIIFIGNFVRSSDMGHEGSIIEKQCRLFGELGACLCSPDFDLGCRSLASLVEFVQRAGARTDYWTAPTLATGRVLGLYPRARRLCAWPVFCVATVKALGEDHQTTC